MQVKSALYVNEWSCKCVPTHVHLFTVIFQKLETFLESRQTGQPSCGPWTPTGQDGIHAPTTPARGSWRWEDQEFKVILNYVASSRPSWATSEPI